MQRMESAGNHVRLHRSSLLPTTAKDGAEIARRVEHRARNLQSRQAHARLGRQYLPPHCSDRHHKLPTSSGRRMHNQVHRIGAITPPIRKMIADKSAALAMLATLAVLGAAFADALGDFYKG